MNSSIDNRENRMQEFIDSINKVSKEANKFNGIQNTPAVKRRKLNGELQSAKTDCLDTIFAKLYKDTLPMDNPKKNCATCDLKPEIHDFIMNRSNGAGTELYVREAIKRTDSSKLKKIMECTEKMCREKYRQISEDIDNIEYDDINITFDSDEDNEKINKMSKDLEFDDLSEIINNNVKSSIQDEVEKSKREKEYNDKLESDLAENPDVKDDATLESALNKLNRNKRIIYQPSLFEAVMMSKSSLATESTSNETVFNEAVEEFTKLNIVKALKLESFNIDSVKRLAKSYLR